MDAHQRRAILETFHPSQGQDIIRQKEIRAYVIADLLASALPVNIVEHEVKASVDAAHSYFVGTLSQTVKRADHTGQSVRSGIKGNGVGAIKMRQNLSTCFAEGAVAAHVRGEWRRGQ